MRILMPTCVLLFVLAICALLVLLIMVSTCEIFPIEHIEDEGCIVIKHDGYTLSDVNISYDDASYASIICDSNFEVENDWGDFNDTNDLMTWAIGSNWQDVNVGDIPKSWNLLHRKDCSTIDPNTDYITVWILRMNMEYNRRQN